MFFELKKSYQSYKRFVLYVLKFMVVFCACYFGTVAIIGLSATGNYYSAFVQNHLDYVSLLRRSLLDGSGILLSIIGYNTFVSEVCYLRTASGAGIHLGFDCLGYGIMSFWIAFIAANTGDWWKKLQWILDGLLLMWLINIFRISLLLIATDRHWTVPLFNHHTWFNIASYILIFVLIYLYDKSSKTNVYESRTR